MLLDSYSLGLEDDDHECTVGVLKVGLSHYPVHVVDTLRHGVSKQVKSFRDILREHKNRAGRKRITSNSSIKLKAIIRPRLRDTRLLVPQLNVRKPLLIFYGTDSYIVLMCCQETTHSFTFFCMH